MKTIIWANEKYSEFHCTNNKAGNQIYNSDANCKSRWIDLFAIIIAIEQCGLYLPDERTLTFDEWQCYLDICNNISPCLTPEAKYVVQLYFAVNRKFRDSNQFKTKSISIIILLSKNIAKLNLRNRVMKCDAILAVMLYEEQLLSLNPGSQTPFAFAFEDHSHILPEAGKNMACLLDVTLYY